MQQETPTLSDFSVVDINNYDINAFDMDQSSVKKHTVKDEKGKDTTFWNGTLTYHGKIPLLIVEGDTYGVQKEDENKKKKDGDDNSAINIPGAIPLPNIVQLPSALSAAPQGGSGSTGTDAYVRKTKYQIGMQLSARPEPANWTPEEARLIDFLENDMRRILAHVLVKKLPILTMIGAAVIGDAQKQLVEDMRDPSKAPTLANSDAQMAHFQKLLQNLLMGKIARKAYRKKKDAQPGAAFNLTDVNSQYDETKYPMLYASIMNYNDKTTKQEVVTTTYKKFEPDMSPDQYPSLTHAEAVAMGNYHIQEAVRLDKTYFGASYSSQLQVGNAVFVYPVAGGGPKNTKIVMPAPVIKKDARLVQRSAVQPGQGGNAPTVPISSGNPAPQVHAALPVGAGLAFDPSSLAGIPGLSMPPPMNYGQSH